MKQDMENKEKNVEEEQCEARKNAKIKNFQTKSS